jgi:O-acetylserine/cysteine efflux transporter
VPIRDTLLAFLVVAIWGINFVVIKLGVAEIPPFLLTTLRFALVAALIVPFFRLPRAEAKWILLLSVTFGTLHFAMLFKGMQGVEGATGSILVQLGVPFSTLLAALFLGDHLGRWRTGGLVLAFSGAAVLAGEPHVPALGPFLLLVEAAFAWALSNILIHRVAAMSPLAVTGWVSFFAVPQAALWSALFEDGQAAALREASWLGWGALLYVALGSSIIAYTAWYRLLGRHSVNTVVPLTLLAPVIGVVASVLILGEILTWQKIVGGALTIVGVGVILIRRSGAAPAPPESTPLSSPRE